MIDLSNAMNPARFSAMHHAQQRANRESQAMLVFVAPPNTSHSLKPGKVNVWFVRSAEEGQPNGAELYTTIAPEVKP